MITMNCLEDIEAGCSQVCYLDVIEYHGTIYIETIHVKPKHRLQGVGTKVMTQLCTYADHVQKPMDLTPVMGLGATSIERLVQFYGRFGFIENKGSSRNMSTTKTMYREPKIPGGTA